MYPLTSAPRSHLLYPPHLYRLPTASSSSGMLNVMYAIDTALVVVVLCRTSIPGWPQELFFIFPKPVNAYSFYKWQKKLYLRSTMKHSRVFLETKRIVFLITRPMLRLCYITREWSHTQLMMIGHCSWI